MQCLTFPTKRGYVKWRYPRHSKSRRPAIDRHQSTLSFAIPNATLTYEVQVALFILIELMLFPFGCGVILDLSTLPLFPDTSLWNRLEYCANAPVAAAFFHWMLGTMCMSTTWAPGVAI